MTASTIFTNNRSQAVRLPVDMRFPEGIKKVEVRAVGQECIIAPADAARDSFFIDGPTVSGDSMMERASQQQAERDSF